MDDFVDCSAAAGSDAVHPVEVGEVYAFFAVVDGG